MRTPMVRLEQEGVGTGQAGAQHAELPGLQAREAADLGEARAHQREVMMTVGVADAPHALEHGGIAQVPAERVAGIGRIGDEAAVAHDLRRLPDQAQLGAHGV